MQLHEACTTANKGISYHCKGTKKVRILAYID